MTSLLVICLRGLSMSFLNHNSSQLKISGGVPKGSISGPCYS